ncbi:M14 family zinc carboxypeptidase [Spirochaeta dissipatitropha]
MQRIMLRSTFWLLGILQLVPFSLPGPFSAGTIGLSTQDRPIRSYRVGSGDVPLLLIGAIHAGYEANTIDAVTGFMEQVFPETGFDKPDISIYFVPNLNPDGNILGTRHNANRVDLNRNWDTPDWKKDVVGIWSLLRGEGGSAPFSEPETVAARNLMLAVQESHTNYQLTVVFLHSLRMDPDAKTTIKQGLVQPAYFFVHGTKVLHEKSLEAASLFSEAGDFILIESWPGGYETPGEAIHWAAKHDIIAFDVEFPTAGSLSPADPEGAEHFERFHKGMIELFNALPEMAAE